MARKVFDVEKKKADVVKVVRYFRRWDFDNDQISSSGGMTAVCKLDYSNMTLTIYPAFCAETDNFSKSIGLAHAYANEANNIGFMFHLHRDYSIHDNIKIGLTHQTFLTCGTSSKSKSLIKHLYNWANDYAY